MANKFWKDLQQRVAEGMMAFDDPALLESYRKHKKEKEKATQEQAFLDKISSGLMGEDVYLKGFSGERKPEFGIRTPEEKIKLAESMSQFQRQQDIGKYQGAKATLEAPPVSTMERPRLLAMPKEQAKQAIAQKLMLRPQAREAIEKTPAELRGRNFLLTAEGKYRETAPKLPKDMNKDVFSVAAKLAGDPLMYDDQTAYRQAIIDNIPQAQEILKQTKTTPVKTSGKSPYKEFPDAFLEDGVWKVMRKGKKYKIED